MGKTIPKKVYNYFSFLKTGFYKAPLLKSKNFRK